MVTNKNLGKERDDKFSLIGKITYDFSKKIQKYNVIVVLTKERKKHILERHPEMDLYIPLLIEYINQPDEVILDKKHSDTKNIIKNLDKNSFIFITVKFAKENDLLFTSIISARYQTKKK